MDKLPAMPAAAPGGVQYTAQQWTLVLDFAREQFALVVQCFYDDPVTTCERPRDEHGRLVELAGALGMDFEVVVGAVATEAERQRMEEILAWH